MKRSLSRTSAALGISAAVGFASLPTRAATFTVDSTADAVDAVPGDGSCATAAATCTLRAAIQEANALAGSDIVNVPAGTYTRLLAGDEDAAAAGDLDITGDLDIFGAGSDMTVIDAVGLDRVLHVLGPATVTLSGVTVRGGNGASDGGGISSNSANLTLTNVRVEGNSAPAGSSGGGGVSSFFGSLAIVNSTITGNSAGYAGGGIFFGGSTLQVSFSTIHSNVASYGGGLNVQSQTATIANSTISSNSGRYGTGGIDSVVGTLNLNNVTVTGNSGVNCGGYLGSGGIRNAFDETTINIKNTIVAGNSVVCGGSPECSGMLNSQGYNLIQDPSGCTVVGDTATNITQVSPALGPLADNGGPTQTHALLAGSPARNTGDPANCPSTDQRGEARPQEGRCDIGAYEFPSCGNGLPDAGEQCDDGNASDSDGCKTDCTLNVCSDGAVYSGVEQCDDGNLTIADGCSAACQSELIPGGTPKKTDCIHEWLTNPVTAPDRRGWPANRLQCADVSRAGQTDRA